MLSVQHHPLCCVCAHRHVCQVCKSSIICVCAVFAPDLVKCCAKCAKVLLFVLVQCLHMFLCFAAENLPGWEECDIVGSPYMQLMRL